MFAELDILAEELILQREIDEIGTIRYYNSNNQLHRVGGPAVIHTNGTLVWCQNGQYHRLDGPAVFWADGFKLWYINDIRYNEEEFNVHPLVIEYAKSKQ